MHRPIENFVASSQPDGRFRVWILHCEPWQPKDSSDLPPKAIVLEPAEADYFSADEVRDYLEGFNASPDRPRALWAIAVPVAWRADREISPGAVFRLDRKTAGPRRYRPKSCVQ